MLRIHDCNSLIESVILLRKKILRIVFRQNSKEFLENIYVHICKRFICIWNSYKVKQQTGPAAVWMQRYWLKAGAANKWTYSQAAWLISRRGQLELVVISKAACLELLGPLRKRAELEHLHTTRAELKLDYLGST